MKLHFSFLSMSPAFAQSAGKEAGGGFFILLLVIGVFVLVRRKNSNDQKAERARLIQSQPPTIVRQYRGRHERATQHFRRDAADLATLGYCPTNQSWAQGEWGTGQYLLALLLCLVVVGIGIFLYMLLVKTSRRTYRNVRATEGCCER